MTKVLLESPVLITDALGFSQTIGSTSIGDLKELGENLERQFHEFDAKVPRKFALVSGSKVIGTREFATLRFNDMFVLHATRKIQDSALAFLISGSLLFHKMLLEGQIPRGGLGFGEIYRSGDLLIGNGFLDAYHAAEKRDDRSRNICAVQLSLTFLRTIPNTEHVYRLLCRYDGNFYIHPYTLTDPDMGLFSPGRVLRLLQASGANGEKLVATERFLEGLEDYDSAKLDRSDDRPG